MTRSALAALVILLLGASAARAGGGTCCVCQIGLKPAYQRGFFRKGCETWLQEQKGCSSSAVIDAETKPLPVAACAGGSLRLGYVGHWSGVGETYNYYLQYVQPAMNEQRVSVYWDNTACKGLDKPDAFLSLFKIEKDYLLKRQELRRRSNEIRRALTGKSDDDPVEELPYAFQGDFVLRAIQVRSIGMWDRFIGGSSANFWVQLDVQNGRASYPSCGAFEGKDCWLGVQEGDEGRCDDGGVLRTLACKPRRASPGSADSGGVWADAGRAP